MRNSLLFFFLLLSSSIFGQPDNWYFSVTMGGSYPIGSFVTKNPLEPKAGFAQKGFAFNLDATYPFSDHWGFKGMVMLNTNSIERSSIGTLMENRMKQHAIPFTEAQRDKLTLTVDPWMSNSMVIGPVYTINFNDVYWDFHVLAGMNFAYLPKQKLLFSDPSNNWDYFQQNTTTSHVSLDVLAGMAIRLKMSESVHLKLAVDYQHSRPKTDYEELKITRINAVTTTEKLGTGTTTNPQDLLIGTIGFVYYL